LVRFYTMHGPGVGRRPGRYHRPATAPDDDPSASGGGRRAVLNTEPPGATMQSDTITEDLSEATAVDTSVEAAPAADAALVEEDLLVEEVSIDGMCGVY
jgi:mycofactocin precursor